jgi:DNA-binding LacI/PurR family transcriptional regulator
MIHASRRVPRVKTSIDTACEIVDRPGPRAAVIRTITDWLQSGRLRSGEPLPSARSISRELRVDPRTVGVALNMLEEEGLIRQRSNGRRIVNAEISATQDSFLRNAVIMVGGDATSETPQVFAQAGWALQLELSARRAIQSNDHHFVALNLSQLQDQLPRLMQDPPLGVIVADPEHVKGDLLTMLKRARDGGLRVVIYGDVGHYDAFDRVMSDHAHGAYALTQWLIGQGRRKPALLLPAKQSQMPWVQGRRAGYERACREAGIGPCPTIELPRTPEGWGDRDAFTHKARLIAGYLAEALTGPDPVDALLASSDGPSFAVAAACRLLHRNVHEDVAIVGYDNYWEGSPERSLEPTIPLATVDKRNDLIGRALFDLLADRVADRLPDEPQCRVIEPELIELPQGPAVQ